VNTSGIRLEDGCSRRALLAEEATERFRDQGVNL